jgi:hypothetical protein
LILIPAIILFWPVLWRDPVGNFILAFKESSKFPWEGYVLFRGIEIPATQLPWNYLPVWIAITTPLLYLVLFIAGLIFIARKFVKTFSLRIAEWLNLYVLFLPVFSVIFLHSVVYDGWRHLYFIYPSLIFIALAGLENIFPLIRNKIILAGAKIFLFGYLLYVLVVMVRLHPYQNLYFNMLAGKSLAEIHPRYETDYWGLSYKEGIDFVLKSDSSSRIVLYFTEPAVGKDNIKIFPEKERARLSVTENPELADYFITAYRYRRGPFDGKAEYNVIRDKGVILSVYYIKDKTGLLSDERFRIHLTPAVETNVNIDAESPTEPNGESVNPEKVYAAAKSFIAGDALKEDSSGFKYVDIYFRLKTTSKVDMNVVLQMDSGGTGAGTYEWITFNFQSTLANQWMKKVIRKELPFIHSPRDIIKIYFWNNNKNEFFVDDVKIEFFSVPEEKMHEVRSLMP